jgi:hypothetical protein
MLFRGGIYRSNIYRGGTVATTVVYAVPSGDIIITTPQGSVINYLPQGNTLKDVIPQGNII